MNDTLGKRLKTAMQRKGWNQSDLARAVGLTRATISLYLKDEIRAKPKNLTTMAAALGVNEAWLLGFDVGSAPFASSKSTSVNDKEEELMMLIHAMDERQMDDTLLFIKSFVARQ